MKRLFHARKEDESITATGAELTSEVKKLFRALVRRWTMKGYSRRDLTLITIKAICELMGDGRLPKKRTKTK